MDRTMTSWPYRLTSLLACELYSISSIYRLVRVLRWIDSLLNTPCTFLAMLLVGIRTADRAVSYRRIIICRFISVQRAFMQLTQ
jgi:hypothetical protein